MKTIATSVVILAAAVYVTAGESSLRAPEQERELKKPAKKPNANGMGYGNRCCRDIADDICADANVTVACPDYEADVSDDRVEKFELGFPGCAWDTTEAKCMVNGGD